MAPRWPTQSDERCRTPSAIPTDSPGPCRTPAPRRESAPCPCQPSVGQRLTEVAGALGVSVAEVVRRVIARQQS